MPVQNMTVPTDYGTELEGIERRRKMADVLRQQAFQPMETNRTAGGYVVPVSPFEGLAKLLQAHAGNKIDEQAKQEKTKVTQGYNQRMADTLRKAYGPVNAPPENTDAVGIGENLGGITRTRQPTSQESITALEGSGLPQLQQQALTQRQKLFEHNLKLDPRTGIKPSSIQEWNYYNTLSPADQKRYLEMKRNPAILNLGSSLAVRGPGGGISENYTVNLKPGERPENKGAQARATAEGKETGEQGALLVEMEANLPRLETVVGQLSNLGNTATYTKSGQAYDTVRRELGLDPRKAAVARKEYITKVDNEVLPLLRQTFGAQFTQKEGESLKLTLGDPNASPAEKDAVLRSFIDSKRAQIQTQRRKVGLPTNPPATTPPATTGGVKFLGFE